MGTVQKWATLLVGLGALGLVLSNPKGFTSLANGVKTITGGTISQITRGK